MNVAETARKWRISPEVVRRYLREGRVPAAEKNTDGEWVVPDGAPKPSATPGKLSLEKREELLTRAVSGENRTHLAQEFGVNPSLVYRMIAREKLSGIFLKTP